MCSFREWRDFNVEDRDPYYYCRGTYNLYACGLTSFSKTSRAMPHRGCERLTKM